MQNEEKQSIPRIHCFFSERTLVNVYKELLSLLPVLKEFFVRMVVVIFEKK
jgi:hypothetical protein